MKVFTLFLSLLCLPFISFSQTKDTSRVELVLLQKKQSWDNNLADSSEWTALDTSLNSFHYHYPSFWNLQSFLGYLGTPIQNLHYNNLNSTGISPNYDRLNTYRLNAQSSPLYQLTAPLTQAFYVWSTRREEFFSLTHSQNFSENLNIAASYQRISNQGWFQRQGLTFNGVNLNTNYIAPTGRYSFKASASYNNNLSQENGGFLSLDEFAGETPLLNSAESKSRTQDLAFKQSFNLGPLVVDSSHIVINDTIADSLIARTVQTKHTITHELRFRRGFYEFQDTIPRNSFYPGTYSNNVQDKQDLITTDNIISWKPNRSSKLLSYALSIHSQYFLISQGPRGLSQNEYLNNHLLPELSFHKSKLYMTLKIDYGLTGYTKNDFKSSLLSSYQLSTNWKAKANLTLDNYQPEYFFSNYQQSQFQWKLQHDKTQELTLSAALENSNRDQLGITFNQIENYTFLNNQLAPEQWATPISLLQVSLQKLFKLGSFYSQIKASYQMSNQSNILGIPDWILFTSLYYEHTLFSKNMLARFGADLYMTSSFEPYSFYPLMRSFYRQPGFTSGEYPLVDVYFTCQVKTARFFVKATNLYQLATGQNYFLADGYPLNPFSVKLGFNWYFMN